MAPLLVAPPRPQAAIPAAPIHEWRAPAGGVAAQFFRDARGYLLRFPELADFEVSADGRAVRCHPAPGTAEPTYWQLYRNQVAPLMLGLQGALVLHASAVELEGAAVAFVGPSGAGKSTLAAAFVAAGSRFLCDDGLVVDTDVVPPAARPSGPALRLWPDSRRSLGGRASAEKSAFVGREGIEHCGSARPLKLVLLMDDTDAGPARIVPLGAADALVALLRHAFVLDPTDATRNARQFEALAAVVASVRVARLRYERDFTALGAVRALVAAHDTLAAA